MEEQKKEYTAPELTVVEMIGPTLLQEGSFNGETGLAPTSNDHFA